MKCKLNLYFIFIEKHAVFMVNFTTAHKPEIFVLATAILVVLLLYQNRAFLEALLRIAQTCTWPFKLGYKQAFR